ncbi:hypothetical protein BDY24DRAFT_107069 [Mrakia frigida]|uniref:uncharacterized protein n=1 Tax=Mrakia frigida TaxID=29902 RepID=UPI003FCC1A37
MASSSSSSFPFTFRVDPPPSTHTNFEFDQHQARPVALSREEKRRRRRLREERDGEKAIAMGGSDEYEHGHEQKRSWGGMFSAEEGKEVGESTERMIRDSGEPPVKKRRGIAITLVDGVVSGALLCSAGKREGGKEGRGRELRAHQLDSPLRSKLLSLEQQLA